MKKLNKTQIKSIEAHAPRMLELLNEYIEDKGLDFHIKNMTFGPHPKRCPCTPPQTCHWYLDPDNVWQPNCQ